MSNKKPQWLLDAEKAAQEFNESEVGKLSEKEFTRKIVCTHASSCADPIKRKQIMRDLQKESIKKIPKKNMINRGKKLGGSNSKEHLSKCGTLGGKISGERSNEKKLNQWHSYLSELNKDEFTSKDLRKVLEKYNYTNCKGILKSELVEIVHKGINQYDPTIYKKVAK